MVRNSDDVDAVCRTLVSQLDAARARWLDLLTENLARIPLRVVNGDFYADASVAVQRQPTPPAFPFNVLDGEGIEAAIIGWQLQSALGFGLHGKGYIDIGDLQTIGLTLANVGADNLRWGLSTAVFFGNSPVDDDCIATVLAQFLLDTVGNTDEVGIARNAIAQTGLPYLRRLCWLATAVAFDDAASVREISDSLKA